MEAIRQFVKVKNREVNIKLPDDFHADEVEVFVFAKSNNEKNFDLSDEQIHLLENRLAEPESEYISSVQALESLRKKYGF